MISQFVTPCIKGRAKVTDYSEAPRDKVGFFKSLWCSIRRHPCSRMYLQVADSEPVCVCANCHKQF